MKKYSIHDTFCNPIVIPNYPTLQSFRGPMPAPGSSERPRVQREDRWGRAGKHVLSETEYLSEIGYAHGDPMLMQEVYGHGIGKVSEQDVRATADPSPYYFEGKWWLYPTSGRIYSSDDLVNWEYHYDQTWGKVTSSMAPTVEKVGDVYVGAANGTPLHSAPTPAGPWSLVGEWTLPDGREINCGDVMIFADDDGRAYLYFGLGIAILGAELDVKQPNHFLTMPKVLISFHKNNWWERMGSCNENWNIGFIEGSWMLKHGARYHLVYSCSGTQYYNYAMGCYISDSPLGEFMPQSVNPVSRSRNGLIKGGGHGGFVKGPNDTYWVFYTIPVCIDGDMERRIGMDPAGFDAEGNLFAATGIDVPQWKPGMMQRPELGNATELVPLTILKPVCASSYAPGHLPMYATDEALHTWWQPAADDTEPALTVGLRGVFQIGAVRILWKDIGLNLREGILPGPYQYVVEVKPSVKDAWQTVVDASQNEVDLTVDYRTFEPTVAAMVRIRILGAPQGVTPGLLNFTVFGEDVEKPNRQF